MEKTTMAFRYFMPADTYFGRGCVKAHKEAMAKLGKKAMVVTGRTSAKKNGGQKDITDALDSLGIPWVLFDEIGENPDLETVERAAAAAEKEGVEFFIGIGGGSPMDASKAIAVMAANPGKGREALFDGASAALPVVAVPTTAGTGSEATQFSIITLHEKRTKTSIAPKVFAAVSYLDPKYMDTLSPQITNNTAVDALTHLIESYLSASANFISERIVEMGLSIFRECIPALKAREYPAEIRDKLMLASAIGGVAIAQTGTSLPHGMGYFLTYEKHLAHGMANGVLTRAYLEQFPKGDKKVERLLNCLGMKDTEEMGAFLETVLAHTETYTKQDIAYYTEKFLETPQKMATFPYPLTKEDIYRMYEKSLLK